MVTIGQNGESVSHTPEVSRSANHLGGGGKSVVIHQVAIATIGGGGGVRGHTPSGH